MAVPLLHLHPSTLPAPTPFRRFLREYPNIANYVRDIYHTPGVSRAVHMAHIKTHYFTSHPKLNHYAIVPRGGEAWWERPSDRPERFAVADVWMGASCAEAGVGVGDGGKQ